MAEKKTLGHIDCPSCGTVGGMRITHDKNGEPFGFCEAECDQQLRIGGNKRRVRKFLERYPWAAGDMQHPAEDATQHSAPAKPVTQEQANAMGQAANKPATRSPFADAVALLGWSA